MVRYSPRAWARRVAASAQGSELVVVQARAAMLRRLGASVGSGVVIHAGVRVLVPTRLRLGSATFVNYDCLLDATGGITLGDDVSLGFGVALTSQDHEIGAAGHRCGEVRLEPIAIGNGTWLGARTIVLPGVTIGSGVVVGAGSLVTHDLDSNGLYVGSPARLVRELD
jgi:maltose O-acetyltransferase